jgi:hypothetical protein
LLRPAGRSTRRKRTCCFPPTGGELRQWLSRLHQPLRIRVRLAVRRAAAGCLPAAPTSARDSCWPASLAPHPRQPPRFTRPSPVTRRTSGINSASSRSAGYQDIARPIEERQLWHSRVQVVHLQSAFCLTLRVSGLASALHVRHLGLRR